MKAHAGDRIVIAPLAVGGTTRDGEVLETRGPDGAPPYLVRWSDDGHEALYFPGVDARIEPVAPAEASEATDATAGPERRHATTPADQAQSPRHVSSWSVTIDLFDDGRDTSAHAVLHSAAAHTLDAHGAAHRRATDPDIPEIGDEIAVARALRHLADQLIGAAADDIAGVEGKPVVLS